LAMATALSKRTVRINGCVASAQAAKYADVDVITAYPIRPYTATMMVLAQMVANGELDAEYIVADSEHSQLSIAHGASSSGARVLLPQMVCQDGFFVSHITSDCELPDPGQVKEFLPPYTHPYPLDPRHPVSHGPQIMPEQGPSLQLERARAMEGAVPVIEQAH